MKVELKAITPNAEITIVEIARVSSSRKDKSADSTKLISYLIKNHHWSPLEHAMMTIEIETSKAIGIQLLRHRSFTFQEFSQRYSDVSEGFDDMFEPIELREQAVSNRQSSTEVFDPDIITGGTMDASRSRVDKTPASELINEYLDWSERLYEQLIEAGVARECARMILPMCTKTKIYMSGTIRSWIHFLDLRDDEHAQKEIQLIAKDIKRIFIRELPTISRALGYE